MEEVVQQPQESAAVLQYITFLYSSTTYDLRHRFATSTTANIQRLMVIQNDLSKAARRIL